MKVHPSLQPGPTPLVKNPNRPCHRSLCWCWVRIPSRRKIGNRWKTICDRRGEPTDMQKPPPQLALFGEGVGGPARERNTSKATDAQKIYTVYTYCISRDLSFQFLGFEEKKSAGGGRRHFFSCCWEPRGRLFLQPPPHFESLQLPSPTAWGKNQNPKSLNEKQVQFHCITLRRGGEGGVMLHGVGEISFVPPTDFCPS